MCILYKFFKYFHFRFTTSTCENLGILALGGAIGQVFTHGNDDPFKPSDILPKKRIHDKMRPSKMAGNHDLNITTI